ncbi:MAG: hypothetical protein IIT58_01460, partial [Treponema sp.]|nr:hypothetical protein [Treponema sp.]
QVQVSKKILFMTPYAGIRVRFIMSESNYNWKYKTEFYADNDISSTPSKETHGEGTGSKNVALSDFAWTPECINPTLFGGLGLKFGFFDLGLNVSWNMATNYFTFGILTGFKM